MLKNLTLQSHIAAPKEMPWNEEVILGECVDGVETEESCWPEL